MCNSLYHRQSVSSVLLHTHKPLSQGETNANTSVIEYIDRYDACSGCIMMRMIYTVRTIFVIYWPSRSHLHLNPAIVEIINTLFTTVGILPEHALLQFANDRAIGIYDRIKRYHLFPANP